MGKRKSVDVWTMVMFANYNLKRQDITAERKKGICLMVEMILHHSGQYCGFGYVYAEYVRDCVANREPISDAVEYARVYHIGMPKDKLTSSSVRDANGNIPAFIRRMFGEFYQRMYGEVMS